ncbi:MAG: hypothetical protein IT495_17805 [Gammaproteobacteria bacterium]|nr:hypothetical protein [Gammaproteobacteria bacterium]
MPRWAWLWLPLGFMAVLLGVRIASAPLYRKLFDGELGIIELATPAVLVVGIIHGIHTLRRARLLPARWLAAWMACVVLGCVYFAGEELSWGQQLFGWATPEAVRALNDQNETNLHNMTSWLDQKPRLLLELWVLVGGVLLPLLRRRARWPDDDWRSWFWPAPLCFPAAALAILIRMPDHLKDLLHLGPLPLELRWSEPQELYFGVFLALYLAAVHARLRFRERLAQPQPK